VQISADYSSKCDAKERSATVAGCPTTSKIIRRNSLESRLFSTTGMNRDVLDGSDAMVILDTAGILYLAAGRADSGNGGYRY